MLGQKGGKKERKRGKKIDLAECCYMFVFQMGNFPWGKKWLFKGQREIVGPTKQPRTEGALKEKGQVVKAQVEKVKSCDS